MRNPPATSSLLTTIVRQQIEPLRVAIQELSQGRTESGFDQLDQFGALQEIEGKTERLNAIADLHLAARAAGESSDAQDVNRLVNTPDSKPNSAAVAITTSVNPSV